MNASDRFFEPYDRDQVAYGDLPSGELMAYLQQMECSGNAIDMGAGAGRDTIALADAGFNVTAVDLSDRGLERIAQRAGQLGFSDRVSTCAMDVRQFQLQPDHYDAIVATTVLDHLPAEDSFLLWKRLAAAINDTGFLYVQVHTTEDPGSDLLPGRQSTDPVSETADAVIHYFAPNQLASWAVQPDCKLRVLHYEERLEWDCTHGSEHLHGKAILLAVRLGFHPPWYGHPPAFPRPAES